MQKNNWFVLGREKLVSLAEIAEVLKTNDLKTEGSISKINTNESAQDLINKLAGTIKIGEEIASNISEDELVEKIIDELKTVQGKIHFGLSFYDTDFSIDSDKIKKIGLGIKKQLKDHGLSVRYVENREPILSSVTVQKNGLVGRGREFLIQKDTHGLFSVAKTLAVQAFEEWNKRDFGRPGRDDKSGMLPPKLARMMINLAYTNVEVIHELPLPNSRLKLLDPFCGSGTILTEALLLNFQNIIGSDISKKAIEDTKKNIEWAKDNVQSSLNRKQISIKIFELDSKNLTKEISNSSIDVIVTEPYLGKPLKGIETKQELEKQVKELGELYINVFTEFYKILKPGGTVVFIIPRFKFKGDWIRINCLEQIKKSGFRTKPFLNSHEFLLYARKNQHVGREIWRFKKV